MFVLVDSGLHYLNMYINKWFYAQKDRALRIQKAKQKHSTSVIRKKVTKYQSKSLFSTLKLTFFFRSRICLLSRSRQ